MTYRERILAASRKQAADPLPFFHYWRHSQTGWAERGIPQPGHGYLLGSKLPLNSGALDRIALSLL
jgi:hypothetical protein